MVENGGFTEMKNVFFLDAQHMINYECLFNGVIRYKKATKHDKLQRREDDCANPEILFIAEWVSPDYYFSPT